MTPPADPSAESTSTSGLIAHLTGPFAKIIMIGLLALLLLIPVELAESIMHERSWRQQNAVEEIAGLWGAPQQVVGPMLDIPVQRSVRTKDGTAVQSWSRIHVLPQSLNVQMKAEPEVRYRGLYETVVYRASVLLQGEFEIDPDYFAHFAGEGTLRLDGTELVLGLSDLKGLASVERMQLDGVDLELVAGVPSEDVVSVGIHAQAPLSSAAARIPFSIELNLRGTQQFLVTPLGATTKATMASSWASPSFTGSFLPNEREVGPDGFTAEWQVLHLNRNFPQVWEGKRNDVQEARFGVEFFQGADVYQKSIRMTKYAFLFFVFTFTALFLAEILTGVKVHGIQYVLVGLAISIFYVLLIAISEHLHFDGAYLLSGLAVALLIAFYLAAIMGRKLSGMVLGLLLVLYGYFYVLLQLEDFALLMGALGLFILLATVMLITRRINWYQMGKRRS